MKLYTSQVIAKLLNVSERRVRQLRDEGVIEEKRKGLYDLVETNHRYIDYLKDASGSDDSLNYYNERAKLVRTKRKIEELELRTKENKLCEISEIELVMGEMLANFRARTMAIPSKLSALLANKKSKTEIYKILTEAVEEALNELSDFETAFCVGKKVEDETEEEDD